MSADLSTALPSTAATAVGALVTALAAPDLPLEVDLLDDDGLLIARISVEGAGDHLVLDAEVAMVGLDGPVAVDQPVLSHASVEALTRAGLFGSGATSDEGRQARSRVELGLLAGQHERLGRMIRAKQAS